MEVTIKLEIQIRYMFVIMEIQHFLVLGIILIQILLVMKLNMDMIILMLMLINNLVILDICGLIILFPPNFLGLDCTKVKVIVGPLNTLFNRSSMEISGHKIILEDLIMVHM